VTEQRHLTWVAAVATFLTTFSLTPLMSHQPWLWPAAIMITIVGLLGFGGRSLRLPPAVVVIGQLVVSALILTYAYGDAATRWYGLPTLDTLRSLDDLGAQGRLDISRFAPPILAERGVVFLVVAGVTAIAIAVDLLAAGLRRAPLAGLPLLALYTVPIAVAPDGVPWYLFALAAAGYVGLLVAEGRERLVRWGRSMGFSEQESAVHHFVDDVQTGPVARVGRRVGAAAVGLAVALPLVLPNFDSALFGTGSGLGDGGGRTVVTNDPIVDLNRDLRQPRDVEVFRYDTKDPTPDYWRTVTLDTFDGKEWKQSERHIPDDQVATEAMPSAPGITSDLERTDVRTTVQVANTLDSHWLPLPYPAKSLEATGRWVYDSSTLNVFGVNRGTAGLRYSVDSSSVNYNPGLTSDTVPPSVRQYTELPDLPDQVVELAHEVTASAESKYEQAIALQSWFRDPREFTYTLEQDPGHSSDALLSFLEERRGYCEQFAATMAIMARVLGIPARVDIGFTPGHSTGVDSWTVTAHDAHAWPELYFDKLGWVRFEPTPSARTGEAPDWTQPGSIIAEPTPTATPSASQGSGAVPTRTLNPGLEGTGFDSSSGGGFQFPFVPVLIALGIVLVALTPRLIRLGMNRARWRKARSDGEVVLAAWAQLRDDAGDLGFEYDPSDTPRTIAERYRTEAGLMGDAADALNRLARATERVLFARVAPPVKGVRADLVAVTRAMGDAVERRQRLRAMYLPRSTRQFGHAISERVADALDWVESLGARLRPGSSQAAS
jgi:transglutaminase-like putative cysteine protease